MSETRYKTLIFEERHDSNKGNTFPSLFERFDKAMNSVANEGWRLRSFQRTELYHDHSNYDVIIAVVVNNSF